MNIQNHFFTKEHQEILSRHMIYICLIFKVLSNMEYMDIYTYRHTNLLSTIKRIEFLFFHNETYKTCARHILHTCLTFKMLIDTTFIHVHTHRHTILFATSELTDVFSMAWNVRDLFETYSTHMSNILDVQKKWHTYKPPRDSLFYAGTHRNISPWNEMYEICSKHIIHIRLTF